MLESPIRILNAESRTSWPGCSTQNAAWALPLVHSPRQAPKPLDAWFFEAAGDGMHLPSPSRLVASQRLNRWLKRGGLSLGMRRVGPVCGSGLQGGCAPAGHAAGSCNEAHEWAQERITRPTAWAHMYAHPAVKRQDMVGRSCQNTDRNVTNVRV